MSSAASLPPIPSEEAAKRAVMSEMKLNNVVCCTVLQILESTAHCRFTKWHHFFNKLWDGIMTF